MTFSKSIRRDFFSAETKEAREVCCGRKVEGTVVHIRGFFSRQQTASVACSLRVSESVYVARVALLFSVKRTERLEQQYCIKFCQKLGDSQVETFRKIQRVFGDDAMDFTKIKESYNQFKDGRTSVESDARSGKPSTSRNGELIDQVRTLIMEDRRVTV